MTKAKKACYRVTNWREYNESLVRRGDITLWFSEEALASWEHANNAIKIGRPFTYSDGAIECLLTLRELFRLPYRQTEGLGRALVTLLDADVAIPDFTSLAKRAAKLGVSLEVSPTSGPIDVVVDSTGLKVFGAGGVAEPSVPDAEAALLAEAAPVDQRGDAGERRRSAHQQPRRRRGHGPGTLGASRFSGGQAVRGWSLRQVEAV